MKIYQTRIPDVLLMEPKVFEDQRGFFMETYRRSQFEELGIRQDFVQANHSGSVRGTLRGLHYQLHQPQGKLVRTVAGEVFDVVVDIRPQSTTFGQWVGVHLSTENRHMLWVPAGFAHGFYVVSEWAEIFYQTTDYYAPQWERTLLWDDPALQIEWPILPGSEPLLSAKDLQGKPLDKIELPSTEG
jgi:dTDP-4-dehydrorhamnose 3,5-epimerase